MSASMSFAQSMTGATGDNTAIWLAGFAGWAETLPAQTAIALAVAKAPAKMLSMVRFIM